VAIDPAFLLEGLDQGEAMPGDTPADPDIAVGELYILQVVNQAIRVWRRSDLTTFDLPLPDLLDVIGNAEDPRGIFDPVSKRFYVRAFGASQAGVMRDITVAISKPEVNIDPNDPLDPADWDHVRLQGLFPDVPNPPFHPIASDCATGNNLINGALGADQPSLGYYADGILVGSFLGGASDRDAVMYVIGRNPIANTYPVAGPFLASEFLEGATPVGCVPITDAGKSLPRPVKGHEGVQTAFFISTDVDATNETCMNAMLLDTFKLFAVQDPFAHPEQTDFTRMTVGCFDGPPCAETNGGPEELPLQVTDSRVMSAQIVDENGEDFLWITVTLGEGSAANARSAARWHKFALNGWPAAPGPPALVESGPISAPFSPGTPPDVHRFFPSAIVNAEGTLGAVYGRSGPSETASVRVWARLSNGQVLQPKTARQSDFGDTPDIVFFGCARWGDYFDVDLDPLDNSFWITGMYMKQGGPAPEDEVWGTIVRRFTASAP
jgi:hypothetical protein